MALLETLWATIRSMNPTAGQSMLRDLVPQAELMSAVSLYSIGFNFARIVGPSIAPMILASTIGAHVISIFVGTYTRFMPVFAKAVLNVGPDGLGLLMSAPGVGVVLSLIVLGALEERWSRKALLWYSAEATPLLLILFCLSRNLWLSVVLLGLFGGMRIIFRTVSRLIIQVETPREL